MHVPDGYLSPATCGVLYAAATPFWAVAVARVRRAVGGRTVPLLAIFSAFAFAIMMFNVPVPGGTTAHAVGGTFAAVVIGPWAAVISTSVAIIIQALFFGDGGIMAMGANALNMGVLLPLAGYAFYRIIAGRSSMLSERRVVAAAIGAYVGITVAALAVGVELGVQPDLYSHNGVPDYSPYGLSTAIPAMLVAHVFGASFVEAAVTALGLAYLQRSYPELLLRGKPIPTETDIRTRRVSPWLVAGALAAATAVVVFIAGLVTGGSIDAWGGLDWTGINWRDVALTVAVSALISAVALPAVTFSLAHRKAWRGPALIFSAIVIWAPMGLIAPAGAFGEDQSASQADVRAALEARARGDAALYDALPAVNRECDCVPARMSSGGSKTTLFSGYEPPWVSANDPAWKQNLGYQAAALLGFVLLGGALFAAYRAGRWMLPAAPPDWRTAGE